MTKKDAAKPG